MANNFVPEMHDLGKLIDLADPDITKDGHVAESSDWHGDNAFDNISFDKLGVTEPTSATWLAARFHHRAKYADLAQSDLPAQIKWNVWLLCLADNLAASSSRSVPEPTREERDTGILTLRLARPHDSFKRVHKLWVATELPISQPQEWAPIDSRSELNKALELIENVQDVEEFWQKYDDPRSDSERRLALIPEDKTPPRVVTSLRTHLELTGKFYRILKRHIIPVPDWANPTGASYAGQIVSKRSEAKNLWRFQLVRCQLRFPQTPVRARDLNVLRLMEQLIAELENGENGNYLLFHTTDTLWLFLPIDGSATSDQVLESFLRHGFWVDAHVSEFPLQYVMSDLQTWLDEYSLRIEHLPARIAEWEKELEQVNSQWENEPQHRQKLLPQRNKLTQQLETAPMILDVRNRFRRELQEHSVNAPMNCAIVDERIIKKSTLQPGEEICDLCQTRPAQPDPIVDKDGTIVEHLCKECADIRRAGMWLPHLEKWEDQVESQQVAWVKITPVWDEIDLLIRVQFEKFIDQLVERYGDKNTLRAEDFKLNFRGIAPLAEFAKDYKKMLARLASELTREFLNGLEHLNDQIEESFVVKLASGEDALKIVAAFERGMREFFPAFFTESALRLSISIASVKYPFFAHWDYLKAPRDMVNIQIPSRAVRLEMKLNRFLKLRDGTQLQDKQVSRLLHTLADIEAKSGSNILVQARMMEDATRVPTIARLVREDKFSAREVLDYYKLMTLRGGTPHQDAKGGDAEE